MHSFQKSTSVTKKAISVFNLITDVESYPEFVPWCQKVKILSKDANNIVAEMLINYKGFTEKYVSNILTSEDNKKYRVEVTAISGPFKSLNNSWIIEKNDESCRVDFYISLQFKSFVLDKMIGPFFKGATEKMIQAFEAKVSSLRD